MGDAGARGFGEGGHVRTGGTVTRRKGWWAVVWLVAIGAGLAAGCRERKPGGWVRTAATAGPVPGGGLLARRARTADGLMETDARPDGSAPDQPVMDAPVPDSSVPDHVVPDTRAWDLPLVPLCGDGIKSGAEQCDGKDLGGKSCASMGFAGGVLGCTKTCLLSGCTTKGFVSLKAGTFTMGSPTTEAVPRLQRGPAPGDPHPGLRAVREPRRPGSSSSR